jgi:hypothetical protein
MGSPARFDPRPVWAAVVCLLAWNAVAAAQDPRRAAEAKPEVVAPKTEDSSHTASRETLHLVAKAEAKRTKGYIEERLSVAKGYAKDRFNWSGLSISPLDPITYQTLDSIIRQGQVVETLQQTREFEIKPFQGNGDWVVRLAQPHQVLKELKVTFEDNNAKKETRSFKPGTARGGEASELRFHSPGYYTLRIRADAGLTPTEYESLVEDGGKPVLPNPKGEWPKAERYWLITFRDFSGKFPALKEVLENSSIMGNPISNVKTAAQTTFVIGSFMITPISPTDWDFVGTSVIVRFSKLPEREAKRVWMRFPIAADRIEQEARGWRYKEGNELLGTDISAKIRENPAELVPWDRDEPLLPDMEPKWFEIPLLADRSKFERTLRLEKIEEWKRIANKPVYRLVGWEFEGPEGRREFLEVVHPRMVRQTTMYLIDEAVDKWPVGVRALQASAPRGN